MPVRWLVAAFAIVGLLVAGCGGSSDDGGTTSTSAIKGGMARAVAGDWTGQLHQEGLDPFRIAVQIDPSGVGRVAYTGINCAGTWEPRGLMGRQSHFFNFNERISSGEGGRCKGTGRVDTTLDDSTGTERLHYSFTGGGVASRGVLHRTDVAGLRPTFEEAGVKPPD
jgi:hypothetical protein